MPRCFSISIQSEVACRAALRALTDPAWRIAPPYKSSFSVSVVLPASGWDMMAKVRRRATSVFNSGCSMMPSSNDLLGIPYHARIRQIGLDISNAPRMHNIIAYIVVFRE